MEQRQIEGIDTYNFPADLHGFPLLAWMGDDYVRFVTIEMLRRFRQQDASTEMLAIKCEERPKLLTNADKRTGAVQGVVAEFNLQVLLQASNGQCWRLRGDAKFSALGLDQPERTSVSVEFDLRSTEEAV
jgi:hypothetical protein